MQNSIKGFCSETVKALSLLNQSAIADLLNCVGAHTLLLIGTLLPSIKVLCFGLELVSLCFFLEEKIRRSSLPHILDSREVLVAHIQQFSEDCATSSLPPPYKPPSGCRAWNNPTTNWQSHTLARLHLFSQRAKSFCAIVYFYTSLSVLVEYKRVCIFCGNFTSTMQMSIIEIDIFSFFLQ